MEAQTLYQGATAVLGALFLRYGMDMKARPGARNFVGYPWQALLKLLAGLLIAGFGWLVVSMQRPGLIDWLAMLFGISGTAFVVAARRALAGAHTFTGQFFGQPSLVTSGIYAFTRNPLYFGVFQCELWGLIVSLHQLPVVQPHDYVLWFAAAGVALAYAISFNASMAIREAGHLESSLGEQYRRYSSRVAFLVPFMGVKRIARAAPATVSAVLQKRNFRLDMAGEPTARGHWFAGTVLATQILNAYTLLIPDGEKFIIRSCSRYLRHADDRLRNDLEHLFFQEGSHAREHGRLLTVMRAQGMDLPLFRPLAETLLYRLVEPLTPHKLKLAAAAAIEHHNAVIASYFLGHGLLANISKGELSRLLIWHFAEEIEHREVVFALLQRVSRSRLLRICGLAASAVTFLGYLAICAILLALKTRGFLLGRFWRECGAELCSHDGFAACLFRESLRYAKSGFNPTEHDHKVLLESAYEALQRLGMDQPTARPRAALPEIPDAFRVRIAPGLERIGHLRSRLPQLGAAISRQSGAWVESEGTRKLNFCTYSYLGLLHHPRIDRAASQALARYGTGTHGVRLLGGNLELHRALEKAIAGFFQRDDAVTFSSGFMTNVATISSLAGPGDFVLYDRLSHASIVDGCRLSRATACRFAHNDVADLERKLAGLDPGARKLLVVDAVYSMDGDIAPLSALLHLRDRHPNTLLMVDEAHSLGVLGAGGRGIEEHLGCVGAVDVLMGSLSKTVPAQGGYIAAAKDLITYLRGSARGFIFSAAMPPATAAASLAAFDMIGRDGAALRSRLMSKARYLTQQLADAGFRTGNASSAIVPVLLNSEAAALDLARQCNLHGLHAMPVLAPAVPRGTERLRLSVSCVHTRQDLDLAVSILQRAWSETGASAECTDDKHPIRQGAGE